MHPQITKLGHIGLGVRDMDTSLAFYTEALGFKLTEQFAYPLEEMGHGRIVHRAAFIRVGSDHHAISLFTYKDGLVVEGTPPQYGLHHMAFEVPTTDALIEFFNHCRDTGVDIVNARTGGPGNQPRFYVTDPDGNLIEFYWNIDVVDWEGEIPDHEPIQQIDLESFDFAAHIEMRAAMAAPRVGAESN